MPGPSTLIRGSITSLTGQMRTDSPGFAISSAALAIRESWRTAASTASRSTVRRPASYRVVRPKTMSVTGKLPISRRMCGLLARRHRIEKRWARYRDGQRLECGGHDTHAEGVILLGTQRRIAADVLDARAADHAVGARREREVVDGRDHSHRNPDSLDLLGDRCTATIARPSGGDEQRAVDAACLEVGGDAAPVACRHRHRRAHAGQRVDLLVHAADLAL